MGGFRPQTIRVDLSIVSGARRPLPTPPRASRKLAAGAARDLTGAPSITYGGNMNEELYQKGMAMRRKVLGEAHIAKRQSSDDIYTKRQNELVTEVAWGTIWSRPQLPLKVRSLVTLGMLAALNRADETKGHIAGALNNGATPEEIVEVFVQSAAYCGFPASNTCVRLCVEVFRERGLI
jgi:4-carboxymuconolactone decarboxylase